MAEADAAAAVIGWCALLPLALSIAAARAASRPGLPLAALAAELQDAALSPKFSCRVQSKLANGHPPDLESAR
jgi:hypothetical protein